MCYCNCRWEDYYGECNKPNSLKDLDCPTIYYIKTFVKNGKKHFIVTEQRMFSPFIKKKKFTKLKEMKEYIESREVAYELLIKTL